MPSMNDNFEASLTGDANEDLDIVSGMDSVNFQNPPNEGEPGGLDEESGDEADSNDPINAFKAFKREQADIFKTYINVNATKIHEEHVRKQRNKAHNVDTELSISELLAEENRAALTDPREYQLELFERAKKENTIAVLETGSGKTFIAVLLIKYILEQELERKARGLRSRTVFFMVPSNTLVYQQAAVLRSNLAQDVAARCGDMNAKDPLEKKAWETRLEENQVVVCTPEILHQCLAHAIVKIEEISLLIFDEAHHARGDSPYVKIMDFYRTQEQAAPELIPRIFGMTASPADGKQDPVSASAALEVRLKSKIATFPLSEEFKNNAKEVTLTYELLPEFEPSPLYNQLSALFDGMGSFDRLFRTARTLTVELGPWAADRYWQFALREEAEEKMRNKITKVRRKFTGQSKATHDEELRHLKMAMELASTSKLNSANVNITQLSSKVLKLYEVLSDYYTKDLQNRSIVFVEEKAKAHMLAEVFTQLDITYLRPGFITGGSTQDGEMSVTARKQVLAMTKFRKGEINCLFATSVAEEGIDIPDCNIVIRFDLYGTTIRYIQSKGRARHKNSKFVHMVERNNLGHRGKMHDALEAEKRLRLWIDNLDPERKLVGTNDYFDKSVGRVYVDPKTKARLTYWNALSVLSHFASSLPTEDDMPASDPAYYISSNGDGFFCEVVMPQQSPLRSCYGYRYGRKALAKRSAAFEMCIELLKSQRLDRNLLPKEKRQKYVNKNDPKAVDDKKKGNYLMRLKPALWSRGRGTIPATVYMTIIDLPDGLERPHQPIALLTRNALPPLPTFPLFLDSGLETHVQITEGPAFEVSAAEVQQFTTFTLLLWDHVNAKKFEDDATKMSYWVVPIKKTQTGTSFSRESIDWDAVTLATQLKYQVWSKDMPHSSLENRFIVDPMAGNRHFFTLRVDPSLKPLDDIPEDNAKFNRPGASKKRNILQYSSSIWGSKGEAMWSTWDRDQPVVECVQVLHRQNLLAKPMPKEVGRKVKANLCLEPLHISTLSAELVTTFLVFPPIIHRIEDYLIALEACNIVGIEVGSRLALEAMTKDTDNSDDHGIETNYSFRSGMGNNYERLEFMGDCFLKMVTSISLFVLKPHHNEEMFHDDRKAMISNLNLGRHAKELGLPEFVRTMAFSRRLWYPEELMLLDGKGKGKALGSDQLRHALGEKSIADVCEALIGAAFIEHNDPVKWNPHSWTNSILAVSNLVRDSHHSMKSWGEYAAAYILPEWQKVKPTLPQLELADQIYKKQGYRFKSPLLLRSAFTHASVPLTWENLPSYERLEFLGDALLDLACITHLFYNYPTEGPQWLTEHKMAMVSNKFLGAVCVKLGFHRYMRRNNEDISRQINLYVSEVETAEEQAQQTQEADYWTHVKDPPKCLADIVEAYVGALFIDSGFNYGMVQAFFDQHIKPFFEDMSIYDTYASDHPITLFQNTLLQGYGCQKFQLLSDRQDEPKTVGGKAKRITGVIIHRTCLAAVEGESVRYARHRSGKIANDELRGLTVAEFRSKFNCDCKQGGETVRN